MTETIISKKCCACKQVKPISEFCPNRARKDGHQTDCKICHRKGGKKYRQTELGRAMQKRYDRSKKGKIRHVRYAKKYKAAHPEQVKAKTAVREAIRKGQLPPIHTQKCTCSKQAKDYHHHKGYAPEHWLNVIPLCKKCHNKPFQSST